MAILADKTNSLNNNDGAETPTTTPTPTPAPGGAHYSAGPRRMHGTGLRGQNLSRQSNQFEGRFGRMFRTLPAAYHTENELIALADKMVAPPEAEPTPETERDDEENLGISAGYTYFGQFIDHDLTFDPASSLQRQNDPDALTDFRTPRFDLDNIYGRGPDDQPYLYAEDGVHLLLGRTLTGSAHDGRTRDVPRNTPEEGAPKRALIGDPRNDENVIVSQLQATLLRFHNSVADTLARRRGGVLPPFEDVQREVRFHYQWAVLHDFLPTIIGKDTVQQLLPELKHDGKREAVTQFNPHLRFFKPKQQAYIPVEFSVAAYRFGHSMVRPIYRLNTTLPGRQMIFAETDSAKLAESLVGFREFPGNWALDWNLFFDIGEHTPQGPRRLQRSYKIDTSLVNPLGHLPEAVTKGQASLAARNLLRGLSMSLPSGQSVARAMGLPVVPDDKLRVGKATAAAQAANDNPLITDISPNFTDNAPLWYYILAEAQQQALGTDGKVNDDTHIHLGPVGGRIIGEVFVGLMWADSHSYLQQHPGWRPIDEFTKNGRFGIAEIIKAARH
ncbi:MAG: heme peroxidase family protein [Capsulimonas sp.]|nr:heme peroxidase family protein [Capsulimonas sp.]